MLTRFVKANALLSENDRISFGIKQVSAILEQRIYDNYSEIVTNGIPKKYYIAFEKAKFVLD